MEAPYRWLEFPSAGHFPHEEVPDQFHAELLDWLGEV